MTKTPREIREARKKLELSQSEFGEMMGLDGRTIRRYEQERGDKNQKRIPESSALLADWLANGNRPSEAAMWASLPGPVRVLLRWFLFDEVPKMPEKPPRRR